MFSVFNKKTEIDTENIMTDIRSLMCTSHRVCVRKMNRVCVRKMNRVACVCVRRMNRLLLRTHSVTSLPPRGAPFLRRRRTRY